MSWRNVASHYSLGDCVPAHVRVLRELYALHSAGSRPARYPYGGSDRTIDLAARGAWALVGARRGGRRGPADRARAQAVRHRRPLRPRRAVPRRHGRAGGGGAGDRAGAAVRRQRRRRTPTRFRSCSSAPRGTGWCTCHGRRSRVDSDPAHWRFRLARLATPAPPPLRRLARGGWALGPGRAARPLPRRVLPPAEPARAGGVVGRVVHPTGRSPPDAGAPCRLRRRARAHRAVGMGLRRWAERGSASRSRPRARTRASATRARAGRAGRARPAPVRDRAAAGGRPRFRPAAAGPARRARHHAVQHRGPAPARGRRRGSSSRSTARRRSTGRRATWCRSASPPRESDAGTDWFDLGIRISVEGRDVPFADVFAALAAGESHLLLPDGAYFSLHKPELQALRTLIEEARALQDSPVGPAAAQPLPGRALGRAGGARRRRLPRRAPGSSRSRACWRDDGPGSDARPRAVCAHSCVPTSATASTGCATCGGTGSAACSPTTWGWARRCRRSP